MKRTYKTPEIKVIILINASEMLQGTSNIGGFNINTPNSDPGNIPDIENGGDYGGDGDGGMNG